MTRWSLFVASALFALGGCSRTSARPPDAARDTAINEALEGEKIFANDPRTRGREAVAVLSEQYPELASGKKSFDAIASLSVDPSQVSRLVADLFRRDPKLREAFDKACPPGFDGLHPEGMQDGARLALFRKACGEVVKVDASEVPDVTSMAYALTVAVSGVLEAGGALSEKERALVHQIVFVGAKDRSSAAADASAAAAASVVPSKLGAQVKRGAVEVNGRLTPEEIIGVFEAPPQQSRLRACYEAELAKDPTLAGTMAVRFFIERDGKVSNAGGLPAESTLTNPALLECVVGVAGKFTFPLPQGGIVKVKYPLRFSPPR